MRSLLSSKKDNKMKKVIDAIKKRVATILHTEGGLFSFSQKRKTRVTNSKSPDTLLQAHNRLVQTGFRVKATVLSIDDSGKMVHFNPIIRLSLRLDGDDKHTEIWPETIVSLLNMPRIQEQITIAYLPDTPNFVAIIAVQVY
jgi:hypothetical protein